MAGVSNPSHLQLSDRQNAIDSFNFHCVPSHLHHLCTFLLGLIPLITEPLMRMLSVYSTLSTLSNLPGYHWFSTLLMLLLRASRWCSDKGSTCQAGDAGSTNPWVRKIPWRREWQRTPGSLPGKPHGQGSYQQSTRSKEGQARLGNQAAAVLSAPQKPLVF